MGWYSFQEFNRLAFGNDRIENNFRLITHRHRTLLPERSDWSANNYEISPRRYRFTRGSRAFLVPAIRAEWPHAWGDQLDLRIHDVANCSYLQR